MTAEGKYYRAYEDRYRRVYSQGIDYWTANPAEISKAKGQLDAFLEFYSVVPESSHIVEFGCGEGFLGQHLRQRGFSYLGIDLSPSAIEKARARAGGSSADCRFVVGDITNMEEFQDSSFDIAIDNFTLQMLVTDPDREQYLREALRVLKPGGKAYFHEISQPEKFTHPVKSFEDFVAHFKPDYDTLEKREAFMDGEMRAIEIPRVPSRFNSPAGYREELTEAGFVVDRTEAGKHWCMLYAGKAAEPAD